MWSSYQGIAERLPSRGPRALPQATCPRRPAQLPTSPRSAARAAPPRGLRPYRGRTTVRPARAPRSDRVAGPGELRGDRPQPALRVDVLCAAAGPDPLGVAAALGEAVRAVVLPALHPRVGGGAQGGQRTHVGALQEQRLDQ